MKRVDGVTSGSAARFIGSAELWTRLDKLTRVILGISAREFAEGFARGRFERLPIAADLGKFLLFALPPSLDEPS